MSGLKIGDIRVPARVFRLEEAETAGFGRVRSFVEDGRVWGRLRPDEPDVRGVSDEAAYRVQRAVFDCRAQQGIGVGALLRIEGADWTVQAVWAEPDHVRFRLERVLS